MRVEFNPPPNPPQKQVDLFFISFSGLFSPLMAERLKQDNKPT